jgi:ATP-binding cassette, subfamily A (ABC1), member 3
MAEGQLRCAGSALFLKKMYGVGYQLTIEKNVSEKSKVMELNQQVIDKFSEDSEVLTDSCSPEQGEQAIYDVDGDFDATLVANGHADSSLTNIVKRSVPEATLLNDVGTEVRYQLPIGSSDKFAAVFEQLDREVDQGNIVSYGVSITTLGTLTSFSSALLLLVVNSLYALAHVFVSFHQRKFFCLLLVATRHQKVRGNLHHRGV